MSKSPPSVNVLQTAARFYDARDSLRRALGDDYDRCVAPWRDHLRGESNYVQAVLPLMQRLMADGEVAAAALVLAACADLADEADARNKARGVEGTHKP